MASTVLIKFGCWLWCRLIKNSSVQALAQDAMTDVVFNIFSSMWDCFIASSAANVRLRVASFALCFTSDPPSWYDKFELAEWLILYQILVIFPILGSFFRIWWLDALGGLLLSIYVIVNWSRTTTTHIRQLTGAAAPAAERNVSHPETSIQSFHDVRIHRNVGFCWPLMWPELLNPLWERYWYLPLP